MSRVMGYMYIPWTFSQGNLSRWPGGWWVSGRESWCSSRKTNASTRNSYGTFYRLLCGGGEFCGVFGRVFSRECDGVFGRVFGRVFGGVLSRFGRELDRVLGRVIGGIFGRVSGGVFGGVFIPRGGRLLGRIMVVCMAFPRLVCVGGGLSFRRPECRLASRSGHGRAWPESRPWCGVTYSRSDRRFTWCFGRSFSRRFGRVLCRRFSRGLCGLLSRGLCGLFGRALGRPRGMSVWTMAVWLVAVWLMFVRRVSVRPMSVWRGLLSDEGP